MRRRASATLLANMNDHLELDHGVARIIGWKSKGAAYVAAKSAHAALHDKREWGPAGPHLRYLLTPEHPPSLGGG